MNLSGKKLGSCAVALTMWVMLSDWRVEAFIALDALPTQRPLPTRFIPKLWILTMEPRRGRRRRFGKALDGNG